MRSSTILPFALVALVGCNDKKTAALEDVEALKVELAAVRTDAQNAKLAAATAVAAAEEAGAAAKVARSVADEAEKTAKEAKAASLDRKCTLTATPPKPGAPAIDVGDGKMTINRRALPDKPMRKDVEAILGTADRLVDGDVLVYDKAGLVFWTEKTGELKEAAVMLAREDGFAAMPTKTFEGRLTLDKLDLTVETFIPGRDLGELGELTTGKNIEGCFSRFTVKFKR